MLDDILKRRDWAFYVSRKFNWFIEDTQIKASQAEVQKRFLGFSQPVLNYLILNGDEYDSAGNQANYENFLEKQSAGFFTKFAAHEKSIAEDSYAYAKNLQAKVFKKLSDDSLRIEFDKFYDAYLKSFVPAWVRPDTYLEKACQEALLKDFGKTNGENWFGKIAKPEHPELLAYTQEPHELLHIGKSEGGELKEHAKKYSWLKNPLDSQPGFSLNDYRQRLEHLGRSDVAARIQAVDKERSLAQKDFESLLAHSNASQNSKDFAKALRQFIFLRTYTTEASDHLFYIAQGTIFSEVARRLDLNLKQLLSLGSAEISQSIKVKKTDTDLIEQRQQGFAIVWLNGKVSTIFGDEALHLQKQVAEQFKSSQKSSEEIVKGRTASRGYAKGTARVIGSYKDAGRVQTGDILVTSMTTPEFITAMEKAAAFVTDEGGITCHAAIVAREFGVPCIVGTVNATSAIKDGQQIEVMADEGIVKLLG